LRVTVFLVTAILDLAVAICGFFILLIGLNGFSERQATPTLIFYVIFCLTSLIILSYLGTLVAKAFVEKGWMNRVWAAVVSILSTSIVSGLLVIVAVFAGFALAEFLRTHR
jgi:hypothetical protein